jgi:hypothetical protein
MLAVLSHLGGSMFAVLSCPRRSVVRGCCDRCDHDLLDRDSLQVGELLTERVSFGRDPADDAVGRF